MKNTFLILFSALLSLHALADANEEIVPDNGCFVISGTHHDHNGALKRLKVAESRGDFYRFAGYDCQIFNSYSSLKVHLRNSDIPKDSPIFVIQTAHGGLGGTAALNGGNVTSAQILKHIRDISADYRVAFLNQSCFGGNNLVDKIQWEQDNSNSETIDRTCMWADSSPGRVSVGLDSITKSARAYNLEEAFSRLPDGILSSAAWEQVKMPEYFKAMSLYPGYQLRSVAANEALYPHASRFLRGVTKIIQNNQDGFLSDQQVILDSALFALAPSTTDQMVKRVLSERGAKKLDVEPIRQAIFFAPATDNVCSQVVRKFIVSQWYMVFNNFMEDKWSVFESNLVKEMHKQPGFLTACQDRGEENQTTTDWANWVSQHSPVGELMLKAAGSMDESALIFSSYKGEKGEQLRTATLEEMLNKKEIMINIIGRSITRAESVLTKLPGGLVDYQGFPFVGVKGATGNILPAFVVASIRSPLMKNPLDERRRNACRSIRLKAWQN